MHGRPSVKALSLEQLHPDASITNASDALWWVFVTITTVGYGDRYPVSNADLRAKLAEIEALLLVQTRIVPPPASPATSQPVD